MPDLALKDLVTFGTALLGAGLGIINTWAAINQRKVRLRVRPSQALLPPHGDRGIAVEIINLSSFAITIAEVGFVPPGVRGALPKRIIIPRPITSDSKPWPRRLDPREAVSAYVEYDELRGQGRMMARAFARTSCGEIAYGQSPALKQLRRQLF